MEAILLIDYGYTKAQGNDITINKDTQKNMFFAKILEKLISHI